MFSFKLTVQPCNQLFQLRIISAGKRRQRDLIVSGSIGTFTRRFYQLFYAALPHGPVQKACLAKTAAPRTAAEDLQHDPVMHNFNQGNNQLCRYKGIFKIFYYPAFHSFRYSRSRRDRQAPICVPCMGIQTRHIKPLILCKQMQKRFFICPTLLPSFKNINQLVQFFLSVA